MDPAVFLYLFQQYNIEERRRHNHAFRQVFKSIQTDQERTVANEACSAGRVLVNGKAAKAGTNVKPGDRIDIQFGNRETAVEVVSIAETVKKDEAADLYKFL